ncbi:MAG: alpha-1,4-glucan--maltose-1-phosphate maltosyltransferase [Gemmatimonadales bacterium]
MKSVAQETARAPVTGGDPAARAPTPAAAAPPPRVVIEGVSPEIDAGRFPAKRAVGDRVVIEADIFTEGHDRITALLRYRREGEAAWRETPMLARVNDRWTGDFVVDAPGTWEFTLIAWVDHFASWREGLAKKLKADQQVGSELLEGALLLRDAATRAEPADARWLEARAAALADNGPEAERGALALAGELLAMMDRYPDRAAAAEYARTLKLWVDRERAVVGAWYELFPRSCGDEPGRHGTFRDVERRLPYVAGMGFDVLYLPPVHPIGRTNRKGPNNTPAAQPGDPGSPWGIGSAEGGHDAVHPELGTLEDFDRLVTAAGSHDLEIALDIAFQCTPDHPWVTAHPEWFRHRPDGTIQYAENPPKKYQDIYPLNFDNPDWKGLWEALRDVVLFWIGHGVKIFRVDNPHTKPFAFWEWMIREIRTAHPDVIFLSEAFTRPRVKEYLAKAGFTQSYTYFTWRNTRYEITEYLTELTQGPAREYLRPNLFTNTPDILHEFLQTGGRPAFQIRLILAATLGASYGIYGPAFELCEGRAVPGTEEYRDSEKFQIREWNLDDPSSLRELISRVNRIRRQNPALHRNDSLRFFPVDNEQLIAYGKHSPDKDNIIVTVVSLDPHHPQSGWVELPLESLGLDASAPYQMHDLLGGGRYLWSGSRNFVMLDPGAMPAQLFRVRRRLKTERDFDYYA